MDIESLVSSLRDEFLTDCLDHLDDADQKLHDMIDGCGDFAGHYEVLLRHVHSIKGTAATFGFPAITVVAHRLEDYIEALKDVRPHLNDIQVFLDRIRQTAESGINPEGDDYICLVRSLPRAHNRIAAVRPAREVNVLLVMDGNVQRRIIGQELSSCGFCTSFVARGIDAIATVLSEHPDIVIANGILEDMSGMDLARCLDVIEETHGTHFILLSSSDSIDSQTNNLPEDTAVIHKDAGFAEQLTRHLMALGLFGNALTAAE